MSEKNVGKGAIAPPPPYKSTHDIMSEKNVGKGAIAPPPPPPPYKSTQNSRSDAHQRTNAGTKEA
jgi:hypothetical protein